MADTDKKLLGHIVSWVHCPTIMSVEQVEQMIAAHRLQSVAAATAANDAKVARLRDALLTINVIAAVQIGGSAQGNEVALKMIHDKTEDALSKALEAE